MIFTQEEEWRWLEEGGDWLSWDYTTLTYIPTSSIMSHELSTDPYLCIIHVPVCHCLYVCVCHCMFTCLCKLSVVLLALWGTPGSSLCLSCSPNCISNPTPLLQLTLQPMEVYVDDETKLTLHGLQQHYVKLLDREKNRKLFDLVDVLEFNQVRLYRMLFCFCFCI